jgi:Delta3-Delta2-enoyl-CoA isomerase
MHAWMSALPTPHLPGLRLTKPSPAVTHLMLDAPPVNILGLQLWQSLRRALDFVEADGCTVVLVISSALDRPIFCAGNDLDELLGPTTTADRFSDFWRTSSNVLVDLYESPLHTIAALRGATPGGGCALAMCCDERLALAQDLALGLNEAAMGLPVPRYWAALFLKTAGGHRARAERMLGFGTMVSADEAREIGLVGRIVDSDDSRVLVTEAEALAAQVATAMLLTPAAASLGTDVGRRQTKQAIRGEFAVRIMRSSPHFIHPLRAGCT